MLRTDLINLVNKGSMWAFVGSGASIDSGFPSWKGLIERVASRLQQGTEIVNDERFKKAFATGSYPQCFSRIEALVGRDGLEKAVTAEMSMERVAGGIITKLAEWPFAGYVTTNYDGLLHAGVRAVGELGWTSVGNALEEVRKVSGDVTNVIWHIHGSIGIPRDRARLVLSDKDYDDLYLDSSPAVSQLRALLTQRRIVFIGFGFQDPEVLRLLKLAARFCNPAHPAFAFLGGLAGREHEAERIELLEKYNVDVIPYHIVDGSHEALLQLLEVYGSFVLKRTLRFGQPQRPCPSYDPETTSLLVYNHLALKGAARLSEDVLGSLLKARVLSVLKYQGASSFGKLKSELSEKIKLVRGATVSDSEHEEMTQQLLEKNLQELMTAGYISPRGDVSETKVATLTNAGSELLGNQAAIASRLSEQFGASLRDRAFQYFPGQDEAAGRVALAAQSFLKECINKRALGVAMVWDSATMDFQRYHMVALLQALPDFMAQLASADEAQGLIRLIQDVLARPSTSESKYLGVTLQAQFGLNLLGYDPNVLQARARGLAGTLFLIDASTLIPFLGRSSVGHYSARLLLERIKAAAASSATTQFLAIEVAEHARWAKQHVLGEGTPLTPETLMAATGRAGSGSNVFLEGFFEEVSRGESSLDFGSYLDSVCSHAMGHNASDEAFVIAIRNAGVPCMSLEEWEGFSDELWAERDSLQELVAQRRKASKTYKHDRQVKAEAEALIIIRSIRNGSFRLAGRAFSDAYFVSNTRVIENLTGPERPVTMRPEAILQWLSTLTVCQPDELSFLINGLLWELSERQLSILDKQRLGIFAPLTVASRERLQEEEVTHRAFIAQRYGEDASKAFKEVTDLEAPVVLKSYSLQKAEQLEKELDRERKRVEVLQAQARLTEKERQELEELKTREKFRRQKALSKKRGAASRPHGRRKKK